MTPGQSRPIFKVWSTIHGHLFEVTTLVVLLVVGLTLRIRHITPDVAPVNLSGDVFNYYYTAARNLVEGRSSFQNNLDTNNPLQIYFLAATMLIAPAFSVGLVQSIQIVVSAIGVLCGWYLVRSLTNPVAAILFAAFMLFSPTLSSLSCYLGPESNYIALVLAAMLAGCRLIQAPSWAMGLLAGVLCALAALQRFNALWIPCIIFALYIINILRNREVKRSLLPAIVFLLPLVLSLSLWTARNYKLYGDILLTLPRGGVVLNISNYAALDNAATPYFEDYYYKWEWMDDSIEQIERETRNTSRMFGGYLEYNRAYGARAKQYVESAPLHALRNYMIRLGNQYILPGNNPLGNEPGYVILWLVSSFVGLVVFTWHRSASVAGWLPVIVYLYFVVTGALFHITMDGRMNILLKILSMIWSCYLASLLFYKLASIKYRNTAAPGANP